MTKSVFVDYRYDVSKESRSTPSGRVEFRIERLETGFRESTVTDGGNNRTS